MPDELAEDGRRPQARSSRPRVAIIGAGACGTLSTVHLVRAAGAAGVDVLLIDANGVFGPGVAYRTSDPLHLLNVPAARMGAIAGDPGHFHSWLAEHGSACAPAEFLARGTFGEYLTDLLAEAEADRSSSVTRITGEALAIAQTNGPHGRVAIELDDGSEVAADSVVLALGPLASSDPVAVPPELASSGRYIADPWAPGALDAALSDRSVLILGSGLTMVDVALSLRNGGHVQTIEAVSRNGLTPLAHRAELTDVRPFPVPRTGRLDPILAAVFAEIEQAREDGRDWRDVLDSMRAASPEIWRSLEVGEQRRFVNEINRAWDVHRFRMAPAVAERFGTLREQGRVRVQAASVVKLEASGEEVRATLRAPSGALSHSDVERVINCTGSGLLANARAPALIAELLATGTARVDPLGIGLDVDRDGALIDSAGRSSGDIHVVGALRKGVEWETIGVTEFRDQAARIAELALSAGEPL